MEAFVAMHMRSDAAPAPAKAQQQPQFDWSRMSPITLAQWGHSVSESKLSGKPDELLRRVFCMCTSPRLIAMSNDSFHPALTPQSGFEAPGPLDSKRESITGFHNKPGVFLICSI
jgi:hypothetical protein